MLLFRSISLLPFCLTEYSTHYEDCKEKKGENSPFFNTCFIYVSSLLIYNVNLLFCYFYYFLPGKLLISRSHKNPPRKFIRKDRKHLLIRRQAEGNGSGLILTNHGVMHITRLTGRKIMQL